MSANATATVKNSAFLLNGTTGVGGGVHHERSLTITKSSFMNNAAPVNGGAINVQAGGTATVVKSGFTRNRPGRSAARCRTWER